MRIHVILIMTCEKLDISIKVARFVVKISSRERPKDRLAVFNKNGS